MGNFTNNLLIHYLCFVFSFKCEGVQFIIMCIHRTCGHLVISVCSVDLSILSGSVEPELIFLWGKIYHTKQDLKHGHSVSS